MFSPVPKVVLAGSTVTLCCGLDLLPPAPPSGFTEALLSNCLIPSGVKYSISHGLFQSVHQLSKMPFGPYKSSSSMVNETIGMVEFSLIKYVSDWMGLSIRFVPLGKQRTLRTALELIAIGPLTRVEDASGSCPFKV